MMMKVLKLRRIPMTMRTQTKYIVIHCSATKNIQDITIEDIDRWHKERGFSKVGYHFYVRKSGDIEVGRNIDQVGAHAKGYNSISIGICYEGGLNPEGKATDTRTWKQKRAIKKLIRKARRHYGPIRVYGHRDLPNVNKECPCFNASDEYNKENIYDS